MAVETLGWREKELERHNSGEALRGEMKVLGEEGHWSRMRTMIRKQWNSRITHALRLCIDA